MTAAELRERVADVLVGDNAGPARRLLALAAARQVTKAVLEVVLAKESQVLIKSDLEMVVNSRDIRALLPEGEVKRG